MTGRRRGYVEWHRRTKGVVVAGTALASWVLTMLVGGYMFAVSMGRGRPAGQPAHSHWPTWLMFVHASLAVGGAAVWVGYMATDDRVVAWVSFGDLVLVAALGDVLFATWFKDGWALRRARRKGRTATVKEHTPTNVLPERPGERVSQVEVDTTVPVDALEELRIPVIAVVTHGALAGLTLLLVLLVALGVGS
jgi:hypothetical protein